MEKILNNLETNLSLIRAHSCILDLAAADECIIIRKFSFFVEVDGVKKIYVFCDDKICLKESELFALSVLDNSVYFQPKEIEVLSKTGLLTENQKDKSIIDFAYYVFKNFRPESIVNQEFLNSLLSEGGPANYWKGYLGVPILGMSCVIFTVNYYRFNGKFVVVSELNTFGENTPERVTCPSVISQAYSTLFLFRLLRSVRRYKGGLESEHMGAMERSLESHLTWSLISIMKHIDGVFGGVRE